MFGDALALSEGFLKTDKGKAYVFVGPDMVFGSGIGIGVRKGQPELVANLNRALEAIRADGTYDKIASEYSHSRCPTSPRSRRCRMARTGAGALGRSRP